MQRIWLWWSSGKDSAWALQLLRQDPEVSVERLITTVTPTFDRVAIHGTRLSVLEAQAAAVGVPVQLIELPYPCSNADYEAALKPVLEEATATGLDYMAFGDLFLEDVREYRERILSGTGVEPLFPIWGLDTTELSRQMVESGVEAFITCLDPKRLGPEHAGAQFDNAFLDSLPESVDPCGERGEFHTCATFGPMFERRLEVKVGKTVEREGFVYADLLLAE
ncbi:MAG: ATP-binding protein [Gammaproteobacteria bacterium]